MTTKFIFRHPKRKSFIRKSRLLGICFVVLFSFFTSRSYSQVANDYRSVASGTWATIVNWQMYNGVAWIAAVAAPNSASNVITIQSPNVINIAASVSADQIVVDPGATLSTTGGAGVILTVANGVGVDLTINGTFQESATGNISWTAGATWLMGANGTLIKTSAASSNNWQLNYQGGISTIPATSNWIIRRNTAVNIPVSTTSPATGSVYPNLTIENNVAGTWVMPAASSFSGTTVFPTIKGNFDIGGSGTSTVDFLNSNTFASPALVNGDMTIRAGNNARNYGTGYEIQGNLTVTGSITYDANDARGLTFSGANSQSVSGAGALNIYNMTMNKSGSSLTLNRAITVDNLLTFTNGLINSSLTNLLTINTSSSVTGASNASFVNGPVRYIGPSAFIYPVGKGADYQPLAISAGTSGTSFWTETFSNSCASSCILPYTGPNGTWINNNTGANSVQANRWYVSGQECGNAAGSCGSVCGAADPSLHVGANDGFVGDNGASYDAGGLCGFGICVATDIRAESPVINCTGYSGIVLSFNYIENGQGTTDNATLWYYDGAAWSQIADMAKTSLCGVQGTWTNYSVTLPASANGNPSVQIGFRWVNNDDGVGTDPSFAVDDITLTQPGPTIDFTCEYFYANPQIVFNNNLIAGLDHIDSCEYWILTRNAGTENKNVTLNFDANSCGLTTLPDLRVAHWDGTTWQNEGNTATTGSIAAGTVTSGVVTWFSPFTIASVTPVTPLPIELLSFGGKVLEKENKLEWVTATETNNDYFSVERSVDAVSYTNIATVNGAGNSVQSLHYTAFDESPLNGLSYYRLKQTDYDGKYSFSNAISLYREPSDFEIVNAFNYVEQSVLEITINCSGDCIVQLELFDVQGKKVFSNESNSSHNISKVNIPSGNLQQGVYLLKAYNGNKLITRKISI